MDKKYINYIAMAIALIVAIAIIALVKYFLIPTSKAAGLTEIIIWLESAIMILIMSAFTLSEVVKIGEKILNKQANPGAQHGTSDSVSPFSLIVAFGASVLILLAAVTWISHWVPK